MDDLEQPVTQSADPASAASNEHDTVSRRSFVRSLVGLGGRSGLVAGVLGGFAVLRDSETPPAGTRGRLGILRPPGSIDEGDFLSQCLRCTRCADACEPQCIRFFGADAGPLQGSPYIDANSTACTLCLECGKACPSGAILPLDTREDARMGVAEVDERLCVSHNGTGVCGACYTICPLRGRAIEQDYRNAPLVHPEACVGCGLCEEICIVRDRRAIQVHSGRSAGDHQRDPETS